MPVPFVLPPLETLQPLAAAAAAGTAGASGLRLTAPCQRHYSRSLMSLAGRRRGLPHPPTPSELASHPPGGRCCKLSPPFRRGWGAGNPWGASQLGHKSRCRCRLKFARMNHRACAGVQRKCKGGSHTGEACSLCGCRARADKFCNFTCKSYSSYFPCLLYLEIQ